jgi:hypothetical protein
VRVLFHLAHMMQRANGEAKDSICVVGWGLSRPRPEVDLLLRSGFRVKHQISATMLCPFLP